MSLEDILVHVGTPFSEREVGEAIEGERDITAQRGTPFDCCLFLPQGSEDAGGGFRSRKVQRPTLLHSVRDVQGGRVRLGPDDELFVRAPELAPWTGGDEVKWKVDGMPLPAGRPGDDPVVIQAMLVKVDD